MTIIPLYCDYLIDELESETSWLFSNITTALKPTDISFMRNKNEIYKFPIEMAANETESLLQRLKETEGELFLYIFIDSSFYVFFSLYIFE